MTSSLSQQLKQLQLKEETGYQEDERKRASLIFDNKQAGCIDSNSIKQMARESFQILIEQEELLGNFFEFLFVQNKDINREKLTETENLKVQGKLVELLLILQGYLMNRHCQNIIEYLIRQFEVHKYDGLQLVLIMLPFHSSLLFVKLLQNINLVKIKHLEFLANNIKSGLNIQRIHIVKQIKYDNAILQQLINLLDKQLGIKKDSEEIVIDIVNNNEINKRKSVVGNVLVNFLSGLLVELIEREEVNENLMGVILGFIEIGLKGERKNVFIGSLMVLQMLVSQKQQLRQKIVEDSAEVVLNLLESRPMFSREIVQFYLQLHQNNILHSIPQSHFLLIHSNLHFFLLPSSLNTALFIYRFLQNIIQSPQDDSYLKSLDSLLSTLHLNHSLLSLFLNEIILQMLHNSQSKPQDMFYQFYLTKIAQLFHKHFQNTLQTLFYHLPQSQQLTKLFPNYSQHTIFNFNDQSYLEQTLNSINNDKTALNSQHIFYQIITSFSNQSQILILNLFFKIFSKIHIYHIPKFIKIILLKINDLQNNKLLLLDYSELLNTIKNIKNAIKNENENQNINVKYYQLVFLLINIKNETIIQNTELLLENNLVNNSNKQEQQLSDFFKNEEELFNMIKAIIIRNKEKRIERSEQIINIVMTLKQLEKQIKILKLSQELELDWNQDIFDKVVRRINESGELWRIKDLFQVPNEQAINAYYKFILIKRSVEEQYNIIIDLLMCIEDNLNDNDNKNDNDNNDSVRYVAYNFLIQLLNQQYLKGETHEFYLTFQKLALLLPILLVQHHSHHSQQIKIIIQTLFSYSQFYNKHIQSYPFFKPIKKLLKIINTNFIQIQSLSHITILFNNLTFLQDINQLIIQQFNNPLSHSLIYYYINFLTVSQLKGVDNSTKNSLLNILLKHKQQHSFSFAQLYINLFFINIDKQYFQNNYHQFIIDQNQDHFVTQMLHNLITKKKIKLNIDLNSQLVIQLISYLTQKSNYQQKDIIISYIQQIEYDKQQIIDYIIKKYEILINKNKNNNNDFDNNSDFYNNNDHDQNNNQNNNLQQIEQQLEISWILIELNINSNMNLINSLVNLLQILRNYYGENLYKNQNKLQLEDESENEQEEVNIYNNGQQILNKILFELGELFQDLSKKNNMNKQLNRNEQNNNGLQIIINQYIKILMELLNKMNIEQENEVNIQSMYILFESLIKQMGQNEQLIREFILKKIDELILKSNKNVNKLLLLVLNINRKMKEYKKKEKENLKMIKRISRIIRKMMSEINKDEIIEILIESKIILESEQSWLILGIMGQEIKEKKEEGKKMKTLIEIIESYLLKLNLRESLELVQNMLSQIRQLLNFKEKQVSKKVLSLRKSIGLSHSPSILRYILVIINSFFANKQFQNQIQNQLIINHNSLLNQFAPIYLNIIHFHHLILQATTLIKLSKIKLLNSQIESFIYNILPFEFYSQMIIHLQQQISDYNLKHLLYVKLNDKFQQKSKKKTKDRQKVLQLLVDQIVFDLEQERYNNINNNQNNQNQNNDNKINKNEERELFLQSGLILMSIIGKEGKVEGKVEVLKSLMNENNQMLRQSTIYCLIIYAKSNELLLCQKSIMEELIKSLKSIKDNECNSDNELLPVQLAIKSLSLLITKQNTRLSPFINHLVILLLSLHHNSLDPLITDLLFLIPQHFQLRHLDFKLILSNLTITNIQNLSNFACKQLSFHIIIQLLNCLIIKLQHLNYQLEMVLNKVDSEIMEVKHMYLNQSIQQLLDWIQAEHIDKQKQSEELIVKVWIQFGLKCNEVQLRKHYSSLKTWGDKQKYCQQLFYQISLSLSNTLQSLFTQFYQFIFSDMIELVLQFISAPSSSESNTISTVIQCFDSLFRFDKDQFVDASKLDQIAKTLPNVFTTQQILIPNLNSCLLSLFQLLTDDYMKKTLHQQILILIHQENHNLTFNIITFLNLLLETIKDAYIPLINDVLPYLQDLIDHQTVQIENSSKQFLIRLEQISGENIRDYLRN